MPDVNIPAVPKLGVAPPPGADMTPSQPLQPNAGAIVEYARDPETGTVLLDHAGHPFPTGNVFTPVQQARANERELAPLLPVGAPGTTGDGVQAASGVVQSPREVVAAGPAPAQGAAHVRPADLTRPAASDDEDPVNARPSRGIPGTAYSAHRNPKLQALELGAGFGGPGEYFALDGREVAETVRQMLGEVDAQLDTDLRFSLAASYPRYSVTVKVIVEAEAGDQSFDITMIRGKEEMPLDAAEQVADSVVFVVKRQRREFDDQGEIETPPDALREQLGLVVPQRQVVSTGKFGPLMADVPLGF